MVLSVVFALASCVVAALPDQASAGEQVTDPVFRGVLPVAPGQIAIVSQGNMQGDHVGAQQYAFDLVGRANFPITAAQAGTIIGLNDTSDIQCSGLDWETAPASQALPGCWAHANFVLVRDDDGTTASLYMHLLQDSSCSAKFCIKVGEHVRQGDPLARAGTTGWSTGIHLQFQAEVIPAPQKNPYTGWWFTKSVPVQFTNPEVIAQDSDGVPKTGQEFQLDAAPAPSPSAKPTAYVARGRDSLIVPVNLATGILGKPISLGPGQLPQDIAITPDGKTAYISKDGVGTITRIDLATGKPGTPIIVGAFSWKVAITPDGGTAYATLADNTVLPIDLSTGTPGSPIIVGQEPTGIAITPNGRTAYVANSGDNTVTPIDLITGIPGAPIPVGKVPFAIAITPDGTAAYVTGVSPGQNTVTPIDLATGKPGTPIRIGSGIGGLLAIAITPDGKTAYVAGTGPSGNMVTPINLATNLPGTPIPAGSAPVAIAITPDGKTAFVVNNSTSGTIIPISLTTNTPGTPISVGANPDAIAIAP